MATKDPLAVESVDELERKVSEGKVDTLDSNARYLAYLARVKPVLIKSTRYLAYTSDVGEAARPVVSPTVVRGAYGVSWAYLIGDVGYEGYKARLRAKKLCPDYEAPVVGLGLAKRAIFQVTASMLFPALTIHSIVKYSARYIRASSIKSPFVRTWGASLLGLSAIPALPFIFDEPVEHVVDKAFDAIGQSMYANEPKVLAALHMAHEGSESHES